MAFRFILMLCCLPALLAAQQATNEGVLARAELARKDIEIGDQIWLRINLSAPPGTDVDASAEGLLEGLPGVELIQRSPLNVVAETPERLLEQRFLITSFDTGYIAIEPLPYIFRDADGVTDTAYTNDLLLHVSAYPVTEDSELQPIKPIIEEPRNWLDFWPAYLALLLAGGAYLAWTVAKRRRRPAPPPPPPPPADLQALNRLKELEGRRLWQQGQTKAYYTELTDILRTYLQDRFAIPAREMTSRQITRALGNTTKLSGVAGDPLTELSELLRLSDMVKFAKATPAEELHPSSMNRVCSFVRNTAPASLPASPAEGANEPGEKSEALLTNAGASDTPGAATPLIVGGLGDEVQLKAEEE